LEGILRQIEGVADVAVVGVEDARSGEVPRAFIIREEGAQLSEVDVHRYLETKVSKHKQLAGGVRFVEQIPKNAAGKILRKQLKEQ
jgi:4-coumarate--CoA ligase